MTIKAKIWGIVLIGFVVAVTILAGTYRLGHMTGVVSVPTVTVTPTLTNTPTPTSTSTPTPTATPTSTSTPVPTNTRWPTNTPVATNTRVPTQTPLPTATPGPDPEVMFLEGVDVACQYANDVIRRATGMLVVDCNKLVNRAERDKWRINPMRSTSTPIPTLEKTPGLSAPGLRQRPSMQGDGA